jgi:hypothetical protein
MALNDFRVVPKSLYEAASDPDSSMMLYQTLMIFLLQFLIEIELKYLCCLCFEGSQSKSATVSL